MAHGINPATKRKAERSAKTFDYLADEYQSETLKKLERIQKATGIDFVGHDFRRTAASRMTGMRIAWLTVKKILNHVERGVTAVYDRYSYDAEKKAALEEWSKRLMLMVSSLKIAQPKP